MRDIKKAEKAVKKYVGTLDVSLSGLSTPDAMWKYWKKIDSGCTLREFLDGVYDFYYAKHCLYTSKHLSKSAFEEQYRCTRKEYIKEPLNFHSGYLYIEHDRAKFYKHLDEYSN